MAECNQLTSLPFKGLKLTNENKKRHNWQDDNSGEYCTEWLKKPGDEQPKQQHLKCIQEPIPSWIQDYTLLLSQTEFTVSMIHKAI